MDTRVEHDFIGEKEIANDAYYGVQTMRAIENFDITGIKMSSQPLFINAFAYVKKACAMANKDCGVLDKKLSNEIVNACNRIIAGEFHDQFITDMIQGGAGTSVNMNANEVIANIALESMGRVKGDYEFLHPNNHVNCSQSTNDTYPTAISITLYKKVLLCISVLEELQHSISQKAIEFKDILKMGRTQLQDAVPMLLGQEFNGFATTIGKNISSLRDALAFIPVCNMGGTAIGTMVNTPKGYPELVTKYLAEVSGIPITLSNDLINASSDTSAYIQLSGILKRTALTTSKICNDLRLLSSGPRCGLNEINLPKMQPGSSIMPGKVNPVIPEVVNQTAFYIVGADVTISMAAEAGQLQLNVMEPVIAFSLFTSLDYLLNAIKTLNDKCIKGITANTKICNDYVMNSIGIVTLLNPVLGYETSAVIAKEANASGKSVHEIAVVVLKLVTQQQWDEIYTLQKMVHPH